MEPLTLAALAAAGLLVVGVPALHNHARVLRSRGRARRRGGFVL